MAIRLLSPKSIIWKQLNLIYEPPVVKPTLFEKETVVLRVPYYGKPSEIFGKRVVVAVAKHYPLKKVQVVYDLTSRISQNFNSKDPLPTDLKSGIVYEASCSQCDAIYIGKTYRHFKTRIHEHLSELKKVLFSPVQRFPVEPAASLPSNEPTTTSNFHMTTRSKSRMLAHTQNQRKLSPKPSFASTKSQPVSNPSPIMSLPMKHQSKRQHQNNSKPVLRNLQKEDIDDLLSNIQQVERTETKVIPKSAITTHYLNTGHIITQQNFRILSTEQHRYRLLIKETLLIRQKNPRMNASERSLPLYIFPEGIPDRTKPNNLSHTKATQQPPPLNQITDPIINAIHLLPTQLISEPHLTHETIRVPIHQDRSIKEHDTPNVENDRHHL